MRLEYRMDAAAERGDTLLYYYDGIGEWELALRMACDYFIKEHVVYEKITTETDGLRTAIIVKLAEGEQADPLRVTRDAKWRGVRLELRHFQKGWTEYPILDTHDYANEWEVLIRLESSRWRLGGRIWERTSSEIDEDRKVYVVYAKEAGTDVR